MPKGYYIILEGGEGCGKDTQALLLKEYLESKRLECILTREPGGTPVSEEIAKRLKTESMSPMQELILFDKARKESYDKIVIPSIRKGKNIIKTRGWPSTFAYQGFGGGIDLKSIENLTKATTKGVLPNLIIIFDIPPKKGLDREVIPDRFAKKGVEYHNRVREGYLWVATKYSEISELIPYFEKEGPEKVHLEIRKILKKRLNL